MRFCHDLVCDGSKSRVHFFVPSQSSRVSERVMTSELSADAKEDFAQARTCCVRIDDVDSDASDARNTCSYFCSDDSQCVRVEIELKFSKTFLS